MSALYGRSVTAERSDLFAFDLFTCCLMQFSVHRMRSSSVASPTAAPHRLLGVAIGVTVAAAGSAWALGAVLAETVRQLGSPGRASLDELVVGASSLVALSLLAWVTLGLLVSVTACLPGRLGAVGGRLRDTIAPAMVRRTAALLLGVSVLSACGPGGAVTGEPTPPPTVSAPVAGAAGSAPAPEWVTSVERQSALVGGGPPAPEWTPPPVRALPPVTLTAPRTTSGETTPQEVTVHRGDTLWDLAAAHLSADAGDAEIAEAWQRWWALNRDVIGADPDLILPGQVLLVPEPSR
jgi:hypothetical protein